mgnify:CR=1 FL=1
MGNSNQEVWRGYIDRSIVVEFMELKESVVRPRGVGFMRRRRRVGGSGSGVFWVSSHL